MDFVYICRRGENEELRYSIRSVAHFFPNSNIHIFGGKPEWYCGEFTEVKDYGNKFDNINLCYEKICGSSKFDDFVLMNDDFFVIKPVNKTLHFYDGTLDKKIQVHTSMYGLSKYSRVLSEANKKLKKMGIKEPLNYDIHTPMFFNKEKLSSVFDLSQAPRSMYGNIYKIGGEEINDVKIYSKSDSIDSKLPFISTEDYSFNGKIKKHIVSTFNQSTRYEK